MVIRKRPFGGCQGCVKVKIGFADPRFSYSRAFERYALDLSKHMTIEDVARHLGISWNVIRDIQKGDLIRRFSNTCLRNVKRIAIDEIAVRKGHGYLMDLGKRLLIGNKMVYVNHPYGCNDWNKKIEHWDQCCQRNEKSA